VSRPPAPVRALVACYPVAWRRRYGTEYTILLHDMFTGSPRRRWPGLLTNAIGGALDARLTSGRRTVMTRTPVGIAIWATALFVVGGLALQRISEQSGTGGTGGAAAQIDVAFGILVAAAIVALAAVVALALPAAVALIRGRDHGAWWPVAVPVAAVAVWFGLLPLARTMAAGHAVRSGPTLGAAAIVFGSGAGVVAVTAWAATRILGRVPAPAPARLRPIALTVATAGMAVTTLASAAWGALVWNARPVGMGAQGILSTPFVPNLILVVLAMALATAGGALATRRARTLA